MKSGAGWLCLSVACAASMWAGQKPVSYRLASLPASAEQGQELILCAANVGTGPVDVSLEFINVKTGGVVAEKTVSLAPLGSGAAGQPCLTTSAEAVAAPVPNSAARVPGAMESSFASGTVADAQALVVGVAIVRKALLSFREAQVTASIQVIAPDANGAMRTVETIPLSRATHPSDGAPVYAPAPSNGHHK